MLVRVCQSDCASRGCEGGLYCLWAWCGGRAHRLCHFGVAVTPLAQDGCIACLSTWSGCVCAAMVVGVCQPRVAVLVTVHVAQVTARACVSVCVPVYQSVEGVRACVCMSACLWWLTVGCQFAMLHVCARAVCVPALHVGLGWLCV